MRSVWSCPSCAVLLLVSLVGREASASHAGRQGKNVHRIPKAQVTAHPLRRDEGTCATEYTLCAASLSGGCCPSRYACATDSCYATTAGPTTACGKSGYFPCAPTNGEGKCLVLGEARQNKPNQRDPSSWLLPGRLSVRKGRRLSSSRRRQQHSNTVSERLLPLPSLFQLWVLQGRDGVCVERLLLNGASDDDSRTSDHDDVRHTHRDHHQDGRHHRNTNPSFGAASRQHRRGRKVYPDECTQTRRE